MSSFHTTRRVEFRQTDAAGIAHYSAFVDMMEEVEHEYLRHVGLSVMLPDPANPAARLSWPRVSLAMDYQGSVRFEDLLDIELRVERLGSKSVKYAFVFTHQGRPVASGSMTSVFCRLAAGRAPESVPIPEAIAARIRAGAAAPPLPPERI